MAICCLDICCDYIWRNTMRICCGLPCCNCTCPCCSTKKCEEFTFSCKCGPELDEDFEVGQNIDHTHGDDDITPLSNRRSSNRPGVYTCADFDQICEHCCRTILCAGICVKCRKNKGSMQVTKLPESEEDHTVYRKSPAPTKRSSRDLNLYPRTSNGSTLLISNDKNSLKHSGSLRGSLERETKEGSPKSTSSKSDITTVRMHDIIQYQESVDEGGQKIIVEAVIEQPKSRLSGHKGLTSCAITEAVTEQPKSRLSGDKGLTSCPIAEADTEQSNSRLSGDKGLTNSPITEESLKETTELKSQELIAGSDDEFQKEQTENDSRSTDSNQETENSLETNSVKKRPKLAKSMDSFDFKNIISDIL